MRENARPSGEVVPSGYKRTDVGVIPNDWTVVALAELGALLKGTGIVRTDVCSDGVGCIRRKI